MLFCGVSYNTCHLILLVIFELNVSRKVPVLIVRRGRLASEQAGTAYITGAASRRDREHALHSRRAIR